MSIEVELYEKIRHLHEHDGMSQRAIAKNLSISRNTVKKYFDGSHVPWERQGRSGRHRHVITDDVETFIQECFDQDDEEGVKKQKHTAKRIYDRLVEEKGFTGGQSTIREIVATLKDKPGKSFIPLSYDPGEAIQIDWGVAKVYLAGKRMDVNLFCMRECYGADIFCMAFYRQNEESFLEGQIEGFNFFGGIPKRMIFDNAKVAVKEGFGVHAKLQDRYRAFAAHYAFQCEFCNIAAGHEKGLVEGLVGWVRRNIFVPLPRVETIEELNAEIRKRCLRYRHHKIAGRDQNVGAMAEIARAKMIPLPKYKFDPSKTITAKVDPFSTIKFHYNHYSVPVRFVGKDASVKGFGNEIVIMHQNHEIARFTRCYGRSKTNYHLEHYIDLIEQRPRSVYNAKPVKSNISAELLEVGRRLSGPREMVKLLRLFVDHGEDKLMAAINCVHGTEISVEQIKAYLIPVSMPVRLPSAKDIQVARPQFSKYDALMSGGAAV